MIYLNEAIYTKLTADTELVGILGHTATAPKIFTSYPDILSIYPSVAFWDESTINHIGTIDEFRKTIINFGVFVGKTNTTSYNSWTTKGKALCSRIMDRLENILQPKEQQDALFTSSQVRIESALFISRLPIRFEDQIEIYRCDLTTQVLWYRI